MAEEFKGTDPASNALTAVPLTSRFEPNGLNNLGNTCFFNSVMQNVFNTPDLASHLASHFRICTRAAASKFCCLCLLHEMLIEYQSSPMPICPKEFLRKMPFITSLIRWGKQEDSHEFWRALVGALQRSEPKNSFVFTLFRGSLVNEVHCANCKHISCTVDPMEDLSLEISCTSSSVQDCIERFTLAEILNAENQYLCEKCKCKTQAKKQLRIGLVPPNISIHLKRFKFNSWFSTKIDKSIDFPEVLDLSRFQCDSLLQQNSRALLLLTGIVVHSGCVGGGHYYSYVRKGSDSPGCGNWFLANDSIVRKVSLEFVLKQQAYILFYKRVNHNPGLKYPIPSDPPPPKELFALDSPPVAATVAPLSLFSWVGSRPLQRKKPQLTLQKNTKDPLDYVRKILPSSSSSGSTASKDPDSPVTVAREGCSLSPKPERFAGKGQTVGGGPVREGGTLGRGPFRKKPSRRAGRPYTCAPPPAGYVEPQDRVWKARAVPAPKIRVNAPFLPPNDVLGHLVNAVTKPDDDPVDAKAVPAPIPENLVKLGNRQKVPVIVSPVPVNEDESFVEISNGEAPWFLRPSPNVLSHSPIQSSVSADPSRSPMDSRQSSHRNVAADPSLFYARRPLTEPPIAGPRTKSLLGAPPNLPRSHGSSLLGDPSQQRSLNTLLKAWPGGTTYLRGSPPAHSLPPYYVPQQFESPFDSQKKHRLGGVDLAVHPPQKRRRLDPSEVAVPTSDQAAGTMDVAEPAKVPSEVAVPTTAGTMDVAEPVKVLGETVCTEDVAEPAKVPSEVAVPTTAGTMDVAEPAKVPSEVAVPTTAGTMDVAEPVKVPSEVAVPTTAGTMDVAEPAKVPSEVAVPTTAGTMDVAEPAKVPSEVAVPTTAGTMDVAEPVKVLGETVCTEEPTKDPNVSTSLRIANIDVLVMVTQIQELLRKTGTLVEPNGLYLHIMSEAAFATFETVEEAAATKKALDGLKWPQWQGTRELKVEFSDATAAEHKALLNA